MPDQNGGLSLEEMKALNEADDKATADAEAARLAAEEAAEKAEDEADGSEDAHSDDDDTTAVIDDDIVADDWLKPEGEPQKAPKFTDADMAAQRRKLKGRLKETEDEAEKLRRENEELRRLAAAPAQPAASAQGRPTRDQFPEDDDYQLELAKWVVSSAAQQYQQTEDTQRAQRVREEQAVERNHLVEGHYGRAIAFAEKAKIAPEFYQSTDMNWRRGIATIFGNTADAVADELISHAGPGSEMATHYLGHPNNKEKLDHFIGLFKKNPSGMQAGMYLRELAVRLKTPKTVESRAPEPAEQIRGDRSGGNAGTKLKREYKAASDDPQAMLEIRKRARAQNIDVSKW